MKEFVKKIALFTICTCIFLSGIIEYNVQNVIPTKHEIELLESAYGSLSVSNKKDIIELQNKIFSTCKTEYVSDGEIKIEKVLYRGLCYDRSLILQKILILNDIPIRPLYLYFGGSTDTPLDLILDKRLCSHSTFEFKLEGKWYVMYTNRKMNKMETINAYLKQIDPPFLSGKTNYIRFVSNRNGRFISPCWLPDIYFTK